jgi:hypothetical protein
MLEGEHDTGHDVVLEPTLVIRGTTGSPDQRSTSVVSK